MLCGPPFILLHLDLQFPVRPVFYRYWNGSSKWLHPLFSPHKTSTQPHPNRFNSIKLHPSLSWQSKSSSGPLSSKIKLRTLIMWKKTKMMWGTNNHNNNNFENTWRVWGQRIPYRLSWVGDISRRGRLNCSGFNLRQRKRRKSSKKCSGIQKSLKS